MTDIITIAESTFFRVARLKALYIILFVCVMDVAAMAGYSELCFNMERELTRDCAMALTLVVGLITAMSSAFEIPRELRQKTAQFILSKPMGRSSFIWGKFFGIAALILFNIVLLTGGCLLIYQFLFQETAWGMLQAALLSTVECFVLAGVGLFLSLFLSDALAAMGVFLCFCLGHSLYMLPRDTTNHGLLYWLTNYIFPNFHLLDVKTEITHGVVIPPAYLGLGTLYGIAMAMAITGLAVIIFSRQDVE